MPDGRGRMERPASTTRDADARRGRTHCRDVGARGHSACRHDTPHSASAGPGAVARGRRSVRSRESAYAGDDLRPVARVENVVTLAGVAGQVVGRRDLVRAGERELHARRGPCPINCHARRRVDSMWVVSTVTPRRGRNAARQVVDPADCRRTRGFARVGYHATRPRATASSTTSVKGPLRAP